MKQFVKLAYSLFMLFQVELSYSQVGLNLPYINDGVCPFECCRYGEWVATQAIDVYKESDLASEKMSVLQVNERFIAETGHVATESAGKIVALDTLELYGGPGRNNKEILPTDTLYTLHYQGEGYFKLWYEGYEYSESDYLWHLTNRERSAELLEKEKTVWWVKIQNSNGIQGWIVNPRNMIGSDGCG